MRALSLSLATLCLATVALGGSALSHHDEREDCQTRADAWKTKAILTVHSKYFDLPAAGSEEASNKAAASVERDYATRLASCPAGGRA
jgi:hypothetical protein